jgi:hypothetical protein
MKWSSFINDLPTTSIVDLCKQIANFAPNLIDSSSLPKLELLLHNGICISGRIIKFQETASGKNIWIDNSSSANDKKSLLFLDVNQIIGITILDFDCYQIANESSNTELISTGVLELKRKNKATEELLESLTTKPIPINTHIDTLTDEERSVIAKGLELIAKVFGEILCDEMSKTIVKNQFEAIEIKISDNENVTFNNGILTVYVKKNRTQTTTKQIEMFKEKIESVL